MKKTIKISDSQLSKVIKRMLKESNIVKYDSSNTPVSPDEIFDPKQIMYPIIDIIKELDHAQSYRDIDNILSHTILICDHMRSSINHRIEDEEGDWEDRTY